MADKVRYKLRIVPPTIPGWAGTILKMFPNALVFIGYPTQEQLAFLVAANGILGAFGVSISVEQS